MTGVFFSYGCTVGGVDHAWWMLGLGMGGVSPALVHVFEVFALASVDVGMLVVLEGREGMLREVLFGQVRGVGRLVVSER